MARNVAARGSHHASPDRRELSVYQEALKNLRAQRPRGVAMNLRTPEMDSADAIRRTSHPPG
jgi:CheY-like chemotaxis protein